MRPRRPTAVLLLLLGLACSRRDPPRPQVTPERAAPAPVAALPPSPPPPAPPSEGPVALSIAGGVDVAGLHGRIDRLQIAASGERARLVAEVSGVGAPTRATVAVELAADGTPAPPQPLTVGARDARVIASVAAAPDGFRTLTFGLRRGAIEAADFGNTHRFVLTGAAAAPLRTNPLLFEGDEVVAAADGDRFAAASTGSRLDCFDAQCTDNSREYFGFSFHPRTAFELTVVRLAGGAINEYVAVTVPCAEPTPGSGEEDTSATLVPDGNTAPERCRAQRRDRPYDVALALHGPQTLVAYRTARAVVAMHLAADQVTAPPVVVGEGEVGAPAVAWRGDAVVMVWAQRASSATPYALHAVEWNPATTPRPPAPTRLETGAASAFAPALLTRGSQVVLAWMEGDDRAATVRVGATRQSLAHAIDHAVAASAGLNARDPELAGAGDHTWIAWSEYPAGRRRDQGGGVVRASPLRLP